MNCIILEIKDTSFIGTYNGDVIFERNDLFLPKQTIEFIAISCAFKYTKQKIPFVCIDNVAAMNLYKYGIPLFDVKYQKIIDQCIHVRDSLNANAFSLLRQTP
jgi:hypothetical protein